MFNESITNNLSSDEIARYSNVISSESFSLIADKLDDAVIESDTLNDETQGYAEKMIHIKDLAEDFDAILDRLTDDIYDDELDKDSRETLINQAIEQVRDKVQSIYTLSDIDINA